MVAPHASDIPGVTGETVTIYRDLTGAVREGKKVRVLVEGWVTARPGRETSIAREIEGTIAAGFFTGAPSIFRETIGSAFPESGNLERRFYRLSIDGATRSAWDDASELADAIAFATDTTLDAGYAFTPDGVYLTNREIVDQSFTNEGRRYDAPTVAETVRETTEEVGGAVAETVGAATGGALTGVTGGIFKGLGTGWSIALVLLLVVAAILFVLYVVSRFA